ncbi:TolC family protein [Candidatus Aminicenantes bacterium AC-335-K20]|nr:TolC family protein [SCandidatus Aminicenantes bacterium Aminicenantia_JdfR_composite]MCP2619161.1 TolC family protein [Candidatus Aminicenantes bacterium AC-335-K20]
MKKKYRKIFFMISIILFISSFSLLSQEKIILTLEKSIQLAIKQNPYYLAVQKKVERAKAQLAEARSNFFPKITFNAIHTLKEKLFEIEMPSFIPGMPSRRVTIDFTKDYQFTLNFTQPLFTSGKLYYSYNQAKYNLELTKEIERQARQQVIFEVKRAFFGCLLAREFVKVSREAVELAEKHLTTVKNLYEVGMASQFDLLRAEVRLANLKPQLIKAKNNYESALLGLKTILGIDINTPIELKGKLEYEPFEIDLEQCMEIALENRPELIQLNYQEKIGEQMLKLAKVYNFPTLSIVGNYNIWGNELSLDKDKWQNYYNINLVLSIPIFSGFLTSAKIGQSKAFLKEIKLNKKALIENIKLEVRQAILKIKEAKETLESQEKNVEQAMESVRIAELNYSEGLATSLDVSSAQVALTQAKTNYTQALFDYAVALAQIEKAIGYDLSKIVERRIK